MSAWTEFACFQYLPGELNQRLLEVSPTACLSVSSSGSLGFLLRRASRRFSRLLPSVSEQSYSRGLRSFCHSVSLVCLNVSLVSDGVGIQSSLVSGGCQLDVFPWVFQDSASNLSDLLLVFCCKIYQISFWFFFNTIFYQDCTSCQLASKDTNRSWVGSRDSKGGGQYYLDYSN